MPILEDKIPEYLVTKELDLSLTLAKEMAYSVAYLIIITTPANYDGKKNFFDTSVVENVIEVVLLCNPKANEQTAIYRILSSEGVRYIAFLLTFSSCSGTIPKTEQDEPLFGCFEKI